MARIVDECRRGNISRVSRMNFTAVVETARKGTGGAWVVLPANAGDVFQTRARFPVRVTFNGVSYRGSTMPMGDGRFCVGITKAIQLEAGVRVGNKVAVVVERDTEERTVDVPAELSAALTRNPTAGERFAAMAYTHRREHAEWVSSAKRPETRARRVEQTITRLLDSKKS